MLQLLLMCNFLHMTECFVLIYFGITCGICKMRICKTLLLVLLLRLLDPLISLPFSNLSTG